MDLRLPVSPALVDRECFCLNLKRAARAVTRRYDEALKPVDLNIGQFSTLMSIAGLQPVAMQPLAQRLGMDRTTLTATLKPLQRRRLVSIQVEETDLRTRNLSLTEAGVELMRQAVPHWKKVQSAVGRDIGAAAGSALRLQLARLV